MISPEENDATVLLAGAHADAARTLTAYKEEAKRNKDAAMAAQLAATIDSLAQAVDSLAVAVAASVGVYRPSPSKPAKIAPRV